MSAPPRPDLWTFRSAPPSAGLNDVDMADSTTNASETTDGAPSSMPLVHTPPPQQPERRPIPKGPSIGFHGNPLNDSFVPINSLPEVHARHYSLQPLPPLTQESPEVQGGLDASPSIDGKTRLQRLRHNSTTMVGQKAHSAQPLSSVMGTPHRGATTQDFPTGRDLRTEGAVLLEELGPVLSCDQYYIDNVFKVPAAPKIRSFLETAGGGVLVDANEMAPGEALSGTEVILDSGTGGHLEGSTASDAQGNVASGAAGVTNGALSGTVSDTVSGTREDVEGGRAEDVADGKREVAVDGANEGNEKGKQGETAKKVYTGGVWDPEGNRWALPEKAALEKDIYTPMVKVISHIMTAFAPCPAGVEREVVDTHDARFLHKDDKTTSPDLVIRAQKHDGI